MSDVPGESDMKKQAESERPADAALESEAKEDDVFGSVEVDIIDNHDGGETTDSSHIVLPERAQRIFSEKPEKEPGELSADGGLECSEPPRGRTTGSREAVVLKRKRSDDDAQHSTNDHSAYMIRFLDAQRKTAVEEVFFGKVLQILYHPDVSSAWKKSAEGALRAAYETLRETREGGPSHPSPSHSRSRSPSLVPSESRAESESAVVRRRRPRGGRNRHRPVFGSQTSSYRPVERRPEEYHEYRDGRWYGNRR